MPGTAEPAAAGRVVVIAASAGGVEALQEVLSGLPAGLPAIIVVAQHRNPLGPTALAAVLGRSCRLPVHEALEGEVVAAGNVYLSPADRDLSLDGDRRVRLTAISEAEARPSADHLFAALAAGGFSRAVGVVLTGTGHDGVEGARAVRAAGGVVIAQDEASSLFFGMPGAVIDAGQADRVLPLKGIAGELVQMLGPAA
jgi:two-component system, chemotaxis family, protein-glutamate methylesterase/glutaminase